ncbi:hypothetical protein J2T20_001128 [Paenibacillus wynnii]|nr:hypothetical protein [Paenibacillus wynnii]
MISPMPVEAVPEYAKWGAIAVKETQMRYNADIIDYKHLGRTKLTPETVEEKFKMWLRRHDGKEFGVYVSIRINVSTDVIQSIRFTETDR